MRENKRISREISVFHGRKAPEAGRLAGYGAIIEAMGLKMPVPATLALISKKRRQYQIPGWIVFTPRHEPRDSLYGQLVFGLKYEGVNLLFFRKLFEHTDHQVIEDWVKAEPLSQYTRKIWFLYEWMMQKPLDIPDLKEGNYVPLLDEKLQFTIGRGDNSSRHRIRNNLPGTRNFCPLVFKTDKLRKFIDQDPSAKVLDLVRNTHKDTLLRTSAFLLLKDSKASFNIEGERPTNTRAARWGRAIGLSGSHPLSKMELLRLQQIVIENNRFVTLGFRDEGGFVGDHDRISGEPIPEHISARWQDLDELMDALIQANSRMEDSGFHAVLTAATISFGFIFIHPFYDGNGRIHRYILHHILAARKFTPPGIIFPVSAAILERIDDYRKVLESYSLPLLDLIRWRPTRDNNIEVLSQTADYYKYFDATEQAEFLFECIDHTIKEIIPAEVTYLENFDLMKAWLEDHFEMPDKLVALLVRFLSQNEGKLSERARSREFASLKKDEISLIEDQFQRIFISSTPFR